MIGFTLTLTGTGTGCLRDLGTTLMISLSAFLSSVPAVLFAGGRMVSCIEMMISWLTEGLDTGVPSAHTHRGMLMIRNIPIKLFSIITPFIIGILRQVLHLSAKPVRLFYFILIPVIVFTWAPVFMETGVILTACTVPAPACTAVEETVFILFPALVAVL